ncbi:hypothetical protein [Streptomyces noursei]|uniref:hypothetical protein n=1 Tax=Streptomyces noursei TaxID=1971 RepID=UPI0005A2D321|nr:hypothetical protein [Streptomyces noursei]
MRDGDRPHLLPAPDELGRHHRTVGLLPLRRLHDRHREELVSEKACTNCGESNEPDSACKRCGVVVQ